MNRAVELEGATTSLRPVRSPTFRRAGVAMWTDELDVARSTFVELAKRCREGGDEGSLAVMLFMLAEVECSAGNWSEGGAYADESCEITAWSGHLPYPLVGSVREGADRRTPRTGRTLRERPPGKRWSSHSDRGWCRRASSASRRWGSSSCPLDNPKEANEFLWPLAEGVLASGLREPGVLRFMPDEIEALIAIGDVDTARSLLEPFAGQAEKLNRSWALATSDRGWGLLHASIGQLPESLSAFDRALEHHSTLDEPFELGRTLLAQGQAFRRVKKWRLARESLGRSLGDLRAARRGSVGRQSRDRDGQDRRTVSRPGRPDADRAGGRRAGGAWTHEPRGRPRLVPEREHGRGEPPQDLPEGRRQVADGAVPQALRALAARRLEVHGLWSRVWTN